MSQENEERYENKWNEKMVSRVKVKSNLKGKLNKKTTTEQTSKKQDPAWINYKFLIVGNSVVSLTRLWATSKLA